MTTVNDPAYPCEADIWDVFAKDGIPNKKKFIGLTKREYFAGLAMQAVISTIDTSKFDPSENDQRLNTRIKAAILHADALLKELENEI